MKLSNLKTIVLALSTLWGASYLSACSLFSQNPVLAVPRQISYNDELKLSQLSQKFYDKSLTQEQKMQIFYQRGVLYESLGFHAFAQNDLSQVLNYDPGNADIYNYFGIFAMQDDDYNGAYTAFNMALELDPDYQFAYINRAISLYRNQRYDLALVDAVKFYNYEPNDPIRALWVYLIEEQLDKKQAFKALQHRYELLEDKTTTGSETVAFYLGQISEKKLMTNLQRNAKSNNELAERLCETYFYLGKYYQSKGDIKRAEVLFKYALANNVYNYLEHQQALFELKQHTTEEKTE
ncbi:lipoprotein NlpI [Orbaceae bacterium ac157xtp]